MRCVHGLRQFISMYLRLYLRLISASIRSRMEYKLDFIASSLIQGAMGLYDFLLVAAIAWRFHTIGGWDIYEIGILFAISRLAYGLYLVFANELDHFEPYIVRGDFDGLLTRPWPTLFVLLARDFNLTRLGWIVQGVAVAALSLPRLVGLLSPLDLLFLALAVVWTFMLTLAVSLATAAAAFWIVRIEELQVFTLNAPSTATLYPRDIYPGWLRKVFIYVIPLGLGNYVPAVYLLDKGGSWVNLALPAVIAPISIWLALRLWHLGEARYHSTGS